MDFTANERMAINFLLVKLMKSDGKTDTNEAITLYEINNHIKVSINESDKSLKMNYDECKGIINSMEGYKRQIAKGYFDHMAKIDGEVANVEQEIINDLFGL